MRILSLVITVVALGCTNSESALEWVELGWDQQTGQSPAERFGEFGVGNILPVIPGLAGGNFAWLALRGPELDGVVSLQTVVIRSDGLELARLMIQSHVKRDGGVGYVLPLPVPFQDPDPKQWHDWDVEVTVTLTGADGQPKKLTRTLHLLRQSRI